MKYIQGQNRTQACLFPVSLDEAIAPDNEVRLIDVFVNSLQPGDYGFKVAFVENGRPAYHPADLLKLFIYVSVVCGAIWSLIRAAKFEPVFSRLIFIRPLNRLYLFQNSKYGGGF